jgi:acyl-[acyl carrier protein]--UDP-N-acetylglucosamine O-acyltransferase
VKDDVWLGENVLVLSGVTIGQGAIVGANTVVSKDVEPYSIVAGNPMRFLKYRFPTIVIEQMKQLNFELITLDFINENYELVNEEINETNVVNIINELK